MSPNYREYSIEQLVDILDNIDRDKWPDRTKEVEAVLAQKKQEKTSTPSRKRRIYKGIKLSEYNILFGITHLILIGLCNSVMGWRHSSTNHYKAKMLIQLGSAFYIWSLALHIGHYWNLELPTSGDAMLFLPAICFIIVNLFHWRCFKSPKIHRNTLKWYKSQRESTSGMINLFSIVYVFASIPLMVYSIDL